MTVLRPIAHEDRLSIVDHLDELRTRIFICGSALIVAFAVCFAFNHPLINVLNRALPPSAKTGLGNTAHVDAALYQFVASMDRAAAGFQSTLAHSHAHVPGAQTFAGEIQSAAKRALKVLPRHASNQEKPITIGVGESFTTTLLVAGYFALLVTLPIILHQLYAFVIPALRREERRVAVPAMIASPVLFVIGAVFTYFAVLPPAVHFLQGYNSSQFQVLVQAGSYYRFEIMLMMGIGLAFEVPLVLLALQKAGIITSQTLTLNWRYATVLIAVIVAALPGVDPVTMAMEMLPLVLLYLASIVMLKIVERRDRRRTREPAVSGTENDQG